MMVSRILDHIVLAFIVDVRLHDGWEQTLTEYK
jgi:hypothetical protein